MKYLLLATALALGACATAPGGGPAQPLNCAYADSHCARGKH